MNSLRRLVLQLILRKTLRGFLLTICIGSATKPHRPPCHLNNKNHTWHYKHNGNSKCMALVFFVTLLDYSTSSWSVSSFKILRTVSLLAAAVFLVEHVRESLVQTHIFGRSTFSEEPVDCDQ